MEKKRFNGDLTGAEQLYMELIYGMDKELVKNASSGSTIKSPCAINKLPPQFGCGVFV